MFLHVPRNDVVSDGDQGSSEQLSSYQVLRRVGIRNATDLLRAAKKAKERAPGDDSKNSFLRILGPSTNGGPARLSVIVDAIEDEEWILNLLYWRSFGDPDEANSMWCRQLRRHDAALTSPPAARPPSGADG